MSAAVEGYRRFLEQGGVADLSARTKIRLTGADRVRYLNGQVTANVNRVTARTSLPACVTTAKGKLCADVFITSEPADKVAAGVGGLIVDAEPELRETLLARLERYIIADDVALKDVSDVFGLLHFLPAPGAGIGSLRGVHGSPCEASESQRFGRTGFDLLLPMEAVAAQTAHFIPDHHEVLDAAMLEAFRIEAGIPRWGRELDENTLPPEAGLDRTHIDYHKGCYVGQEVISRLKSVGHINRQLTGFVSTSGVPLAAPMEIFSERDTTAVVGGITSAAWSFALEKPIALGYLKRAAPAEGLFARAPGGEALPITVHALPFIS